jgi:hypothetical protein
MMDCELDPMATLASRKPPQKGKIKPARLVEITIIPAVWHNTQEHDFPLTTLVFHKHKVWTRERILNLCG